MGNRGLGLVGSDRRLAPTVTRLLSFLGCALTLQATPAAAETRRPVPPSRAARLAAPPWSEVGGDSPIPLARTRVSSSPLRPSDHPAVHGGAPEAGVPHRLFPREVDVQAARRRRADAMRRHPAGKAVGHPGGTPTPATEAPGVSSPPTSPRVVRTASSEPASRESNGYRAGQDARPSQSAGTGSYRVRPGDSLWTIAARARGPLDDDRVRALTTRLYDLNRGVVGPDPDLILPGQVLRLPFDLER